MPAPAVERLVGEHRDLRAPDQVCAGLPRRLHQSRQPVGTGNLVVVDHGDVGQPRKFRQRGFPTGIVGMAVAALVRHDDDALEPRARKPLGCREGALQPLGVIVHHHHGRIVAEPLGLQRVQRHHQVIGPAECRQRDGDADSVRLEVR
jgi:hypothetical protein